MGMIRRFFTLNDRAPTEPSNTDYVVANPVRGLLDRKRSEEHLQSSNESTNIYIYIYIETKQKRQKERNNFSPRLGDAQKV